jgi:hypothetical protein
MYGLNEKPKKPAKFEFALEQEIKANPTHGKEVLEKVDKQLQAIKEQLRKGSNEKEYENLDILFHGYTALQKVIKKVMK